tara:strand:- start:905 stop:1075 length:171 start_codon:yes stop_codon:yes gene_type:complete
MIVTIKYLSKNPSVSIKTASREIISKPNVADSTKAKVFVSIPFLGFRNNKITQCCE